jgi:hypothetical protein
MKEILRLFQLIKKVSDIVQREDSEAEVELVDIDTAVAEIVIQTKLWGRIVAYTYYVSLHQLKYMRPELLDFEATNLTDRWFSDFGDLVDRTLDATKGDCNSKGNQMRFEDDA